MLEIYGDFKHGAVNADCLYFDTGERISKLGDRLKSAVPGYDFRIFLNNQKKRILYKTYKELPTSAELAKEKRRKKLDK